MLARMYPRVVGLVRIPSWVLQETILPLLSVSAFVLIYRAMGAPEEYIGFVILGGAMTAFWLNVLWSMGAHFYWERDSGNLELYIMSPASLMAILAGMALGGMIFTMLRASMILLVGIGVFEVRMMPSSWLALLSVFVLTLLALYGLGMMFASLFLLWGREASHLVNLLQEPVYLLSGTNFPVRVLPTAVASIAGIIPLTTGMDAMRQILFGSEGLWPLPVEIALLAVSVVVFIEIARRFLRYFERRAREQGRLSIRWQ